MTFKHKRMLERLRAILNVLQQDLAFAHDEYTQAATAGTDDDAVHAFIFRNKTLIRSFCGLVEGITYALSEAVIEAAREVALTEQDRAVLMEREFDDVLGIVTEASSRLPVLDRLMLALQYFPKLFNATFQATMDTAAQDALKTVWRARAQLTHPKKLEHFYVEPTVIPAVQRAEVWFADEMIRLFAACSAALGEPMQDSASAAFQDWAKRSGSSAKQIFDKRFYAELEKRPCSPAYIEKFLTLLSIDVTEAFRMIGLRDGDDARIGFGIRSFIRSIGTAAEAYIGLAAYYLRQCGQIELSPVAGERVPGRLVRHLTAFSREFGNAHTPVCTGAEYEAFCRIIARRDELVHPKNLKALTTNKHELATLLPGETWLTKETSAALTINLDRFTADGRLRSAVAPPNATPPESEVQ